MIKLRLDVDYPYPSRLKSFLYTALNIKKPSSGYLKNSKIIAKMINDSSKDLKAYWFFTPYTVPDAELLQLLTPNKHEVALHVATQPYKEWKALEEETKREVKYYTVHGTARLLARLMWRRKLWQDKVPIPADFPLKSFYDFPTIHLDRICHDNKTEAAAKIAEESIAKGDILHIHPEWLLQRGKRNPRGPYYETLKTILNVDNELSGLSVRKRGFARVAKYPEHYEYLKDADLSTRFLGKLAEREVDIFTFVERKWCCPLPKASDDWLKTVDNVALLKIAPYTEWLTSVGKKTRNMIRKAEKSGVTAEVAEPTEKFAEGVWRIYNETPVRQGRAFSHYGWKLDLVKALVAAYGRDNTYIGAYLNDELIGFIQLAHGDQIAVMAQILSLQQHWDKAVNNALVAKAVEVCASTGIPWLMYGRIGNHPSLDTFKESNGFSKYVLTRFYVPVTHKGRLLMSLGLHKNAKDTLPPQLKNLLIPIFNWISKTKVQLRRK